MKNNEYLESFKIQIVRKILSGERVYRISKEYNIAKSTIWGWRMKYTPLLAPEFETVEKPVEAGEFVDITAPMRETKENPTLRYIGPSTVSLIVNGYTLTCDVSNLNRVLEMLGYDRFK